MPARYGSPAAIKRREVQDAVRVWWYDQPGQRRKARSPFSSRRANIGGRAALLKRQAGNTIPPLVATPPKGFPVTGVMGRQSRTGYERQVDMTGRSHE